MDRKVFFFLLRYFGNVSLVFRYQQPSSWTVINSIQPSRLRAQLTMCNYLGEIAMLTPGSLHKFLDRLGQCDCTIYRSFPVEFNCANADSRVFFLGLSRLDLRQRQINCSRRRLCFVAFHESQIYLPALTLNSSIENNML